MARGEGFIGQRLRVLPEPVTRTAATAPITRRVLVTDAGHFPHAQEHGRFRPDGASATIVLVCTDGAGVITVGGRRFPLGPGMAAVIPEGTPHSYVADGHDPWTIWWLHVTGTDVPELIAAVVDAPPARLTVPLRDPLGAAALIERIIASMERPETLASLYTASGFAWRLLAQLAADRLLPATPASDRIRVAQEYLEEHLTSRVAAGDLARAAGLSTSHFSALFRSATGGGVAEYVRRLRSSRARELLLTSDLSIADLARAVGYEDPFYFSRQFRRVNGVSPTQYRVQGLRTSR